jgi:hypothetical protein
MTSFLSRLRRVFVFGCSSLHDLPADSETNCVGCSYCALFSEQSLDFLMISTVTLCLDTEQVRGHQAIL